MSPAAAVPALPPPSAVIRTGTTAPAGWSPYTIRSGDTLYDIAARTGASITALTARNQLRDGGRLIRIGSTLLVPGGPPTTGPPTAVRASPAAAPAAQAARAVPGSAGSTGSGVSSYRVAPGDTIEAIARRTGASQSALISANGLRAPYLIRIGQVLTIRKPVATSANTFAGRTYPDATIAAAAAARQSIASARPPSRQQMRAIIVATAARYGVDQRLALAIAYQESGWDQGQVSVANAIGAMQVIPSSGQWASGLAGRRLDLLLAQDNATAGVVILAALTRSSSSLDTAIAGYYQGLGSVQKHGMYADTVGYVASVKALMSRV